MSDVEVLGNGVVEVSVNPSPLIEIEIEPSPIVEIEVLTGGVVIQGGNLSLEYQLVSGRLVNQPNLYREFTYSGDNLSSIAAWASPTKTTQLLSIAFTYTGSNLTRKVLTDMVSGKVLTVTYGYTGVNLTSINEVFS